MMKKGMAKKKGGKYMTETKAEDRIEEQAMKKMKKMAGKKGK